MRDGDLDRCIQLGEAVVEFGCFAFGDLDKVLDSPFAEGHEFIGRKSTTKTFRPCESYVVHLKAIAVEHMHSGDPQHTCKLVLFAALVIVITQHRHDRDVNVLQDIQACTHLVLSTVVGKIACDYDQVRHFV